MSSILNGEKLTAQSFDDFITRLKHDCKGAGVDKHWTADAIFLVQRKERKWGLSSEYSDKRCIVDSANARDWASPKEYWADCCNEERVSLNILAMERAECGYLEIEEEDQWDLFADGEIEDCSVVYYEDHWVTVNSHFTNDAAEAFIARKGHDYNELRVYVDAQSYCSEYNTIKQALMDGSIAFVGGASEFDGMRCDPARLRQAIVAAKAWTDSGIDFVPVPVFTDEDRSALIKIVIDRVDAMSAYANKAEEGDNS